MPPPDNDPHVRDGRLLGAILDAAHAVTPEELGPLLAREAAAVGLSDLAVHLQDYDQLALLPLGAPPRPDQAEPVEGTLAGRAFSTLAPVEVAVDGGVRLWLPLLDGADRVGVLAVTAPYLDEQVRRTVQRLAALAAALLVTKGQYTDLLFRARRRRPTTLAAEMQWQLLPPLMMETSELAIAGLLEPAYEVGGDAFDYALNGSVLHLGIFDAMGHGLRAATMSAVVLGAYRHARRNGVDLAAKYAELDAAVADQFGDDHFATAQLAHLDSRTGELSWFNAGHPQPMLIRHGRVVGLLESTTTLPIGLGGGKPDVATEQLEPGDRVLFLTDGVIEQHAADGDELGADRLADHVERQSAAGLGCPETVRRVAAALLKPEVGLRDDATLLLVEWKGAAPL